MSKIEVRALSKSYRVAAKKPGIAGTVNHFIYRRTKEVLAVDNINFKIAKGEMVGFIGSNGAGKTTTLKMLCGLIHPSGGYLRVAGFSPLTRDKKFLRQITFVMGQKQQLIWDLPPLDSIKVNAAIYGLSEKECSNRTYELASMLDLGDELYRPVRKLSLGERMKAELLAALLHRPSILFLDEPTLGLDINAQVRVRQFLSNYNRKYGATIILTSHYMADITSLCRRVLLIDKGRLLFDGLLQDLIQKLSPSRSVIIELNSPQPIEQLSEYGEVVEYDKNFVRLLIPRNDLTSKISSLLIKFPIKDLEITDPPIEQLIGRLLS